MDIQQIKEAQNYPKISELNKNELFLFSMDIVKKAFLRVNQETTDELIEVTTKDVATFLEAECKALTIKECDIAIIYGLSGEFGVFYRMSVQTIIQFLKAFKSHVNRSQAIIEKYGNVKQLEVNSKDFSIEQLSEFERNAFNEFKQTKRLPIGLPCLPVVKYLISKNKVRAETYLRYVSEATIAVENENKNEIQKLIMANNTTKEAVIVYNACRKLLTDYYTLKTK